MSGARDIRPWPGADPPADGQWWVAEEPGSLADETVWVHLLTPTRRHGCRLVSVYEDRVAVRGALMDALDRDEP